MQRVSDIVGKPIVSGTSGNRLGEVADLLLDEGRGRIVGLVASSGWMHRERVLPFPDVQTLGGDAVIARSGSGLMAAKEWKDHGEAGIRSSRLGGKSIVTASGGRVGSVKDIMVDEQSGTVDALVVSARNGALRSRRRLLPVSSDVRMGRDVVVIPDAMVEQMRARERAERERQPPVITPAP